MKAFGLNWIFVGLIWIFPSLVILPIDGYCSIQKKQTDPHHVLFWHPFRQRKNWPKDIEVKFENRILSTSPSVLNYLYLHNKKNGHNQMVNPAVVSEKERDEFESALASLPEILRMKVDQKFKGIFLVSGMINYALAEYIQDEKGIAWGGVIFIDVDKMRTKTLNALATEKERKLLGENGQFLVSSVMIDPKKDSHFQALRYLLYHEMAHLLAVGHSFHPNWWQTPSIEKFANYTFSKESWELAGELTYVTKDKALMHLNSSAIRVGHDMLAGSTFLSLYALTSPFEDFAESVALTLWEQEGHRRYWIIRENKKIKVLPLPGITSPQFQVKKKLLDQILSHN